MPTYDRLPMLREAVASVLAQTFADWELIVVDDGSRDGTGRWVSSLDEPRIRALTLEHTGDLAALRNRGVEEARGRYVAFLDSDDIWLPDKLRLQVAALEASGASWSYTGLERMDRSGHPLPDAGGPPPSPRSGWILEELLTFRVAVDTPSLVADRELVTKVGGFDGRFGSWVSDYDLIFRLGEAAPAAAVQERLTRIRVHDGAHSADRAAAHLGWLRLYEHWARRASTHGLRRACVREARRHRLSLASRLAESGRRREAAREVIPVVLRRPWTARAWRVLLWHVVGRGLTARLSRRPGTP